MKPRRVVKLDEIKPPRGWDRGLERPREPGMSSRRRSSIYAGYVPAPCTHRPSLLPTGSSGELLGGIEQGRTARLGGRRSRNKVSVGEPADGSIEGKERG